MNIPPLAIVQARMGSTRLPGKVLMGLCGKPLWWHAWNAAVQAFGPENVVVAMLAASTENDVLAESCAMHGARVYRWDGPEKDVLGRFHACAHRYRWHPDSVIVRVTPDDPRKDPAIMRRVASGERFHVEQGAEAVTLAMLDGARERLHWPYRHFAREHITRALFPTDPPPPPDDGTPWTVDTQEDLDRMRAFMGAR